MLLNAFLSFIVPIPFIENLSFYIFNHTKVFMACQRGEQGLIELYMFPVKKCKIAKKSGGYGKKPAENDM